MLFTTSLFFNVAEHHPCLVQHGHSSAASSRATSLQAPMSEHSSDVNVLAVTQAQLSVAIMGSSRALAVALVASSGMSQVSVSCGETMHKVTFVLSHTGGLVATHCQTGALRHKQQGLGMWRHLWPANVCPHICRLHNCSGCIVATSNVGSQPGFYCCAVTFDGLLSCGGTTALVASAVFRSEPRT